MPSIESAVIRVVVNVSDQLSDRITGLAELPQASATTAATDVLLADLARPDAEALESYLDSSDFATVVAQKRIGNVRASPPGTNCAKDSASRVCPTTC